MALVNPPEVEPEQPLADRLRAVFRGLLAVAALLLGGADALATAAAGIPPLAWICRQIGRVIADEYRRGYQGATDAELVEDEIDEEAER
jgi:hypothetical protein